MKNALGASLLLFFLGVSLNAMQLVENGNSKAVIIVHEKAPDSVVYAAKELQTYLKKYSGAELQIMTTVPEKTDKILIYVGYNEALKSKGLNLSDLGYDGLKISSGERWLALFGRDYNGSPMAGIYHPFRLTESYSGKFKINRYGETGTLFAVYHFLEQFCGVRWYMPGDLGEVVPTQKTLTIPEKINIKVTPDFEYRFLYSCDFRDDDESVLWYRRAGFGAPFPVNIIHSFHILKKYKETHPEYFALINGQRDFNIGCSGQGNLCLSNPDVLKCFVKEAREFFDKNPQQYIFPVMPNDSFVKICECPECQNQIDEKEGFDGKFSNYVWMFVNDVAKEVYKSHPDKFIGCCAYTTYLNPPRKLEKLSPNVVITICKTSRNYWNPEYKKKINGLFESWNKKIKQGNLYCWEYYNWISQTPYLRNMPVVFPHIISEDLKSLQGKSKGEFVEAEAWGEREKIAKKAYFPGLTHLNYYVTAKLMWNADTDVNQLLDEYYSKFYGLARNEMKKFWEKAEELWNRNLPDRNNEIFRKLYTVQEVTGLMSCLREARAKTIDGSIEQKRIDLIISEITPLENRVKNSNQTEKSSYVCQQSSTMPKIDGNPNDQCWRNASTMEFVSSTGEMIPHASKAMVCFDDKNLYVFFTNYVVGTDTVKLKTLCKQKDSSTKPYIWDDESIEIFLNPTPGVEKNYYQFIVNAGGIIWDGHHGVNEFSKDPSAWNSNIETSVKINSDSWTLEARIPLSDLGLGDRNMETLLITGNFIRNHSEGNVSCWSPTMEASNHNTTQFGALTFKKKIQQ